MTDVTPATPFWDGYTRSPEVTEQLIAVIRDALYAFPSMRLGQILDNSNPRQLDFYDSVDIIDLYDEHMITNLRNYIEEHTNG